MHFTHDNKSWYCKSIESGLLILHSNSFCKFINLNFTALCFLPQILGHSWLLNFLEMFYWLYTSAIHIIFRVALLWQYRNSKFASLAIPMTLHNSSPVQSIPFQSTDCIPPNLRVLGFKHQGEFSWTFSEITYKLCALPYSYSHACIATAVISHLATLKYHSLLNLHCHLSFKLVEILNLMFLSIMRESCICYMVI